MLASSGKGHIFWHHISSQEIPKGYQYVLSQSLKVSLEVVEFTNQDKKLVGKSKLLSASLSVSHRASGGNRETSAIRSSSHVTDPVAPHKQLAYARVPGKGYDRNLFF